mmetsp:Transcript_18320/g.50518  ORF Transcript_18320/g.50518 Transcript_18320/m.50518 type:complete len:243 (-) Transcript_18320:119-847(-)
MGRLGDRAGLCFRARVSAHVGGEGREDGVPRLHRGRGEGAPPRCPSSAAVRGHAGGQVGGHGASGHTGGSSRDRGLAVPARQRRHGSNLPPRRGPRHPALQEATQDPSGHPRRRWLGARLGRCCPVASAPALPSGGAILRPPARGPAAQRGRATCGGYRALHRRLAGWPSIRGTVGQGRGSVIFTQGFAAICCNALHWSNPRLSGTRKDECQKLSRLQTVQHSDMQSDMDMKVKKRIRKAKG